MKWPMRAMCYVLFELRTVFPTYPSPESALLVLSESPPADCHFLGIGFYPSLNDNKKINHEKDTEQPNELVTDVRH